MDNKETNNWTNSSQIITGLLIGFPIIGIVILIVILINPIYDDFERIGFIVISIFSFFISCVLGWYRLKYKFISVRDISFPLKICKNLLIKLFEENGITYSLIKNPKGRASYTPYILKTNTFEIRLTYDRGFKRIMLFSYNGTKIYHGKLIKLIDNKIKKLRKNKSLGSDHNG
jgi:hypothetical protein